MEEIAGARAVLLGARRQMQKRTGLAAKLSRMKGLSYGCPNATHLAGKATSALSLGVVIPVSHPTHTMAS